MGPLRVQDDGWTVKRYCFSSDFLGFSGHFPSFPILPAMVQVLIARKTAEEFSGHPLNLLRLDKAKFRMRIMPEQEVEVLCREKPSDEDACFDVRIRLHEGVASSFILTCTARRVMG